MTTDDPLKPQIKNETISYVGIFFILFAGFTLTFFASTYRKNKTNTTNEQTKTISPETVKVPLVFEVEPLNIVINVTTNIKAKEQEPIIVKVQTQPIESKPLEVKVEAVSNFRTMLIPIQLDVKDKYGELIPPPKDVVPRK